MSDQTTQEYRIGRFPTYTVTVDEQSEFSFTNYTESPGEWVIRGEGWYLTFMQVSSQTIVPTRGDASRSDIATEALSRHLEDTKKIENAARLVTRKSEISP